MPRAIRNTYTKFHQPTTIKTWRKKLGNPKKIPSCGGGGEFFSLEFFGNNQKRQNAVAIRKTHTKFHWPMVMETLEKIGKNVSGEAVEAEWVLDTKYAIFSPTIF